MSSTAATQSDRSAAFAVFGRRTVELETLSPPTVPAPLKPAPIGEGYEVRLPSLHGKNCSGLLQNCRGVVDRRVYPNAMSGTGLISDLGHRHAN